MSSTSTRSMALLAKLVIPLVPALAFADKSVSKAALFLRRLYAQSAFQTCISLKRRSGSRSNPLAFLSEWGRPINGRTHNEKNTRMHRHAGLWRYRLSRLSARPVGNLSDGHLLAGIRPRRFRRNSVSRDSHKSAITFGNEKSTIAGDGKFVVRERAFQPIRRVANLPDGHLFAGIRAWGGAQ
jgi:hypothetical protein